MVRSSRNGRTGEQRIAAVLQKNGRFRLEIQAGSRRIVGHATVVSFSKRIPDNGDILHQQHVADQHDAPGRIASKTRKCSRRANGGGTSAACAGRGWRAVNVLLRKLRRQLDGIRQAARGKYTPRRHPFRNSQSSNTRGGNRVEHFFRVRRGLELISKNIGAAGGGGGGRPQGDDASVVTHSQDGSLAAAEAGLHSRDSSLATANANWINALDNIMSTGNFINPSSPPHLPLSPTSSSATHLVRVLTPPSGPSSPTKQLSMHSTPNNAPPLSPGSNTPTVRRSTNAFVALEKANAVEKLPENVFLTSDVGDATSSAVVLSPRSNPHHGNTASHHVRHPSVARSGGSSALDRNHRRYYSSIPAKTLTGDSPSFLAPTLLPQSMVGSSIHDGHAAKSNSDVANHIIDILQSTHYVKISFIMPVSEGSLSSIKSGARTQVSLLRTVADLYGITAYDTVTVTQIKSSKTPIVRQSIAADFLTVTFKDQFVSRGDMYKFQKEFINSWVYEGKRLSFNGIQTITKVIRRGDNVVRAALISEDTKLTFRSRSARIIWLVQMSSEMWDFASPYDPVDIPTSHEPSCKIYFDKFVHFVRRLFDKWKQLQVRFDLNTDVIDTSYTE